MRKTLIAVALALLVSGCSLFSSGDKPLDDVPNGDSVADVPLDPEVRELQRRDSEVDDLGTELVVVPVADAADLEAAGLRAGDAAAEPFLEIVLATLLEGLADAGYVLLFDPELDRPLDPDLRGADDLPLVLIERIDREVPRCTTCVSTARQDDEDLVGYGGRMGTATEGICGGIAVMHSLLELGRVRRDQVVDGASFKERPLRVLQGRNRKQMTRRRLIDLHKAGGLRDCRAPAGAGFKTSDRGAMANFNRQLSGLVNDRNNDWDCTLFVRTRQRGKDVLAHFEHVTGVSPGGGRTTITTTNGFDQGNQTDMVPVAPGANTWTSNPGGNPPFKLTASTGRNGANLVRGIPNVGLVNYVCCKRR